MKIKKHVKIGDILKIPIETGFFAIGQVILLPDNDFEYIVVFDIFINERENIDFQNLINAKVLFIAQISGGINTFRREKKWEIVGTAPIRNDVVIPEYKVSTRNGWMVTNWKHDLLRVATDDEIAKLEFHTYYSLAAIETVLQTYWKSDPPTPFLKELMPNYSMHDEK